MASVDAVLLKPGGSTVSEAMTLGIPMLLKSDSAEALPWEKTNMDLIQRLNLGLKLLPAKNLKVDAIDLVTNVKKILNQKAIKKPLIDFDLEFPKLINKILAGSKNICRADRS